MNLKEAKQFVAHFVTGGYTPEEYATFLLWLKGATVDELNAIADEHEALHDSWDVPVGTPSPEWVSALESKLDRQPDQVQVKEEEMQAPVVEMRVSRFKRRSGWIAAASVIVLLAGGTVLYTQHGAKSDSGSVRPEMPALSMAMKVGKGEDGKQFVLSDGSKVWLNTASTLKYPVAFSGPDRVVELSGEAYFEVVPNSTKPFRVLIRDAEVDVLGTNFNVMAYDNEPVSRTTLIDGVVRMKSRTTEQPLKPGQQAEIVYSSTGESGNIDLVPGVNADVVLAWRTGVFKYNEGLYSVMRMVERYYNVGIQYDPNVPDRKITGIISKSNGLKQTLNQLLKSEGLSYTYISDKIVKVTR